MELVVRVAKNVRLRRLLAGLSQRALAERMTELTGRTWAQPQVSDVEHGRIAVTLGTLEQLAIALKVTVSDLVAVPRARDVSRLGPKADLVTFICEPMLDEGEPA